MRRNQMEGHMVEVFNSCQELRQAGQAEYAHDEDNAFANFERIGKDINSDRKLVLYTYMYKHLDGIKSYLKGHKSQREDVRGRIRDMIVYLCLLDGMIYEDKLEERKKNNLAPGLKPNIHPLDCSCDECDFVQNLPRTIKHI